MSRRCGKVVLVLWAWCWSCGRGAGPAGGPQGGGEHTLFVGPAVEDEGQVHNVRRVRVRRKGADGGDLVHVKGGTERRRQPGLRLRIVPILEGQRRVHKVVEVEGGLGGRAVVVGFVRVAHVVVRAVRAPRVPARRYERARRLGGRGLGARGHSRPAERRRGADLFTLPAHGSGGCPPVRVQCCGTFHPSRISPSVSEYGSSSTAAKMSISPGSQNATSV